MFNLGNGKKNNQVYVIFSVDTEHDLVSKYQTKVDGWTKGNPLLFEVFDSSSMGGKVCWLIEYNLKENIVAANPNSVFFVENFRDQIREMKRRGDELGIHPTMQDWVGGERRVSLTSYNDNPGLWDPSRSPHDRVFVENLITSAASEFRTSCGTDPVGCRTGAFRYATYLAAALKKNGIHMDSSVFIKVSQRMKSPNAYYSSLDNIYNNANADTGVLEIPTTGYIMGGWEDVLLRAKDYILIRSRKPIFLSLYIHNWQAVTFDGSPNKKYLDDLSSFLRHLRNNGVNFLTWTEANKKFKEIYYESKI